ncbi:MAG: transglycosylase domain-containing protein [Bacilli bacterium]|nr:transglycosylase domain-containing protein [Bacilli bacterium]
MKKFNKKEKKEVQDMKKKEKKAKTRKKIKFRFWYWLLVLIVFFAICVFIGGIGFCYYIVKSAPEFTAEKMFEKEATRVFDSKGTLIATLGSEVREKISYDEIPEVLVDAIIATEDSRFFQHNGFDAPRFLKASVSQVLGRGGGGASTLTMQLSKLAFTSTEASGIEGIIRKFTDIYMSVFKMEKYFTKYEILEYYVNTPCMGGNIYGVQQASKYYFNKEAKDLNLVEAAMIAGLFQSPNGYNPYNNPIDGNARKNTVLYLMKRHGYITEEEYKAGVAVEVKTLLKSGSTSTNEYQGYIDTVVDEVEKATGNNPYNVPMLIYTTMDMDRQNVINNFYKNHKFRDSKIQVGVGVVDVKTGTLVAVGAGRNKTGAMTLNVATFANQIKRQPGSTIKPIMDYAPAIEYANLSTYGPFVDDKTPYGGGYMKNFGKITQTVRNTKDCLSHSVNTCALQAFNMTTNEQKIEFITKLGIDPGKNVEVLPPSYSIGAFNGTTPVEIAGAYASFASGGYYTKPYTVTKIVYTESDEVYEPNITRERVMKPQTAYMIANILQAATPGTVSVSGTQVATKTGTTSYDTAQLKKFGLSSSVVPDSWISSFSPDYAISIWIGYTDSLNKDTVKNKWYLPNSHAQTERRKILGELANKIYKKNSKFKNPGGFSSVEVELETIPPARPTEYTPKEMRGSFLFIAGTEPSDTSVRYAKLSAPSNITYVQNANNLTLSWTSPGTPQAVDIDYLKEYFKEGYTIWADDYLKKRLTYNTNKIGNFGFDIYVTSGTNSTYLGSTENSSYTINLNTLTGIYDGFIVKSAYSIFKNNASDGVKILFTPREDYEASLSPLSVTYTEGDAYSILTSSNVSSVKLNDNDITLEALNINVKLLSITNSIGTPVDTSSVTSVPGTYTAKYEVSYTHNNKIRTHTYSQKITVNKKEVINNEVVNNEETSD